MISSEDLSVRELFAISKFPTSKYDTYFDVYENLFNRFRGRDVVFAEVGVLGGGSLEVWKKFFGPGSRIIGIDLNPSLQSFLPSFGFEVFIGDQGSPDFWQDFFDKVGKIDILLDDGGHTNTQMWTTLTSTIPMVNDGGLIAIEDVHASYMHGFGNPSRESLINRSRGIIDAMNFRSSKLTSEEIQAAVKSSKPTHLEMMKSSVFSTQFFESIVAFHIDRRKCRVSTELRFGAKENLPSGIYPEDFRSKGVADPMLSIFERLRRKLSGSRV